MTTKQQVLKLLKEGKYAAQIAKELKLSKATVSYHIKSLSLKLDTRTAIKIYKLEDKLEETPKVRTPILSNSPIYKDKPKPSLSRQRIHRLKRSIELVAKPSMQGLKQISLNNNNQYLMQFEGLTLRFTNNLLVLEGLQLIGDYAVTSNGLLQAAQDIADGVLRRAEASLGLELNWGTQKTTIMEFAFTEQEYLKEAKKAGEKGTLTLYWNPNTNKPEIWGDLSFNIGELETNRTNHAVKLRALVKPIIEGRWNVEQQLELNEGYLERLNVIQDDIHNLAHNLNVHIPFMKYTMQGHGRHKPKIMEEKQRRL